METQIINVEVKKETWKQIGIISILKGKDKKDIVEDALNDYVIKHKEELNVKNK